jgi:hypothetical protein
MRSAIREQPPDGEISQPLRQSPQRHQASVVTPLHVVEAKQHRGFQGDPLEKCLEFPEEPVPLLRKVGQTVPRTQICQRSRPIEQRSDQVGHGHDLILGVDRSPTHPDPKRLRHPRRFLQQPRLADPSSTLHEQRRAATISDRAEQLTDRGKLLLSAPQRGSLERRASVGLDAETVKRHSRS